MWIDAKLWIGREQEGRERDVRLYVDGAEYDEIIEVLKQYGDVNAIYFGHAKDWDAVRKLLNKVRIIVEVDDVDEIPADIIGKVEVILRVPRYVDYIKVINRNKIKIIDLGEDGTMYVNEWNGRKLYDGDEEVRI